jgi:hypothetical protein
MADEKKNSINDPLKEFLNSGGSANFGEENNPIEGIYVGCTMEDDSFNPGRQRMVYDIEIEGENKQLTSGSKRLAKEMLSVDPIPGDFIRITRILGATPYDTTFKVEKSPEGIPF